MANPRPEFNYSSAPAAPPSARKDSGAAVADTFLRRSGLDFSFYLSARMV